MTEQEMLQQMFRDAQFIADRYRGTHTEAADFAAADVDGQAAYFNEAIIPFWQAMGCPAPLTEGYLLYQDRLFGRPEKVSG